MWPPSQEWMRIINSPFIRLIGSLLGGLPQIDRRHAPLDLQFIDAAAQYRGIPSADTIALYSPIANERVLIHELGHAAYARNVVPQDVVDKVLDKPPIKGSYAALSESEHVAEAFAEAIESMKKAHFADSLRAEGEVPGTLDFIHWLQDRHAELTQR